MESECIGVSVDLCPILGFVRVTLIQFVISPLFLPLPLMLFCRLYVRRRSSGSFRVFDSPSLVRVGSKFCLYLFMKTLVAIIYFTVQGKGQP